jgi:Matrixin
MGSVGGDRDKGYAPQPGDVIISAAGEVNLGVGPSSPPASGLPQRSIVPVPIRHSWLGSLRPIAQSLMPRGLVAAPSPSAIPSPIPRRVLPLALAAVAGVIFAGVGAQAWRSHHHSEITRNVGFGHAGLRKTTSGASELWTGSTTITIDPSMTALTSAGSEPIVQAFGTWASSVATLPHMSFDMATTPGRAVQDGVNRIVFAPITIEGFEGALAITITYADDATGSIVEADTIFNTAYRWTSIADSSVRDEACGGSYDLQNVATHEAGHFLGLGEDYADKTATMYVSSSTCQTTKRVLSATDVSVMSGLYAEDAQGKTGCGGASVGGGRAGGAGPLVVLLTALVGAWRRRSSSSKQRRAQSCGVASGTSRASVS